MRRLKVEYLPEAKNDLATIYEMILWASRNPATAYNFLQRIRARCRKIGDVPRGGRRRDDLAAGLRTVPFEHSAIIAYNIGPNRVNIVNVFYGGRDFEALYLDSPIEDDDAQ